MPGCGREDLVEALPTLGALHEVAGRIGWTLGTKVVHLTAGSILVARDLCPSCFKRVAVPADGGAPSTHSAEPVGPASEPNLTAASSGTLPASPPAVPVGGGFSSPVTTVSAAAGATGIGPCTGRQSPSFSEPAATICRE